MSRLKQAVKEGKENGLDVRYLWSCIQHSDMNNVRALHFRFDFQLSFSMHLGTQRPSAHSRASLSNRPYSRSENGSSLTFLT